LRITLLPETTMVRVAYRTSSDASGLQWLAPPQTADGISPFLYSQSQAIHARSWFPCQDTPSVRTPYRATVHAPPGLQALMSADLVRSDLARGEFTFAMELPVPSYLVALAVGHVEFADIGPRTGVWAEPSVLAQAKSEFADMDSMLVVATCCGTANECGSGITDASNVGPPRFTTSPWRWQPSTSASRRSSSGRGIAEPH
jgi:aminopeptidase N